MKKTRLAALGLGALSLAGLVGAGVGLSVNNNVRADEVKAVYSQGSVIASNRARLWIGQDQTNPLTTDSASITLWIHSTESGESGEQVVYNTAKDTAYSGSFNNGAESGRTYFYFDIDLSCYTSKWYCTVQRYSSDGNKWWTNCKTLRLDAENAQQVFFVHGDWNNGAFGSISSVDAGLAAKALAGIQTCSSSDVNGYNAFANYNSTFVKNGESWKTVGNLSDYSLEDYSDKNDYSDGEKANVTYNAYDKYQKVQGLYNLAHPSPAKTISKDSQDVSTPAVVAVVAGASGVAASGVFLLIRKKKFI